MGSGMWQIIGQSRAVSLLQRSLERGAVAHAYLVVGPPHVGKMTLALNLAQALNCSGDNPPCGQCDSCQKIASGKHADVQVIGLENAAEIGIDQVRQVQHSSNLPPFEGKHKVFIIERAELLSIEAANCLLKTLEEPAAGVVFILLASRDSFLPSTVVSRCQRLELFPLPSSQVGEFLSQRWGVEGQRAQLLARLSHGCLGWAIAAASDERLLKQRAERLEGLLDIIGGDYVMRFDYVTRLVGWFGQSRGMVQEILDLWLDWWRDLLLVKLGSGGTITNVDQEAVLVDMARGYRLEQIRAAINGIRATGEHLRQNANPRLAFEVLMLNIPPGGGG
jgi:DNA polymerase-3 subunit delta'